MDERLRPQVRTERPSQVRRGAIADAACARRAASGDRPRLVFLVNIPRFFVTHRLPLAEAARAAGYEVHVATSDVQASYLAPIRAAGFAVHVLPISQHGAWPPEEIRTAFLVYRLYAQLQPDLVHHVGLKATVHGGVAARLAGVPAVVNALSGLGHLFTSTAARERALRAAVKPVLRFATGGPSAWMILQNPENRELLARLGVGDPDRCLVIRGSGVDLRRFRPSPEPDGRPVVLFAGRPLRSKGLPDFVEAARRIATRARFVVASLDEPGNPDAVPAALLRDWQQAGWIEWWGQRDDMPEVFRQANVGCLPTRYGEGVPKALIEAAACGRAIVASDVPGCREIVRSGDNGILVPEGHIESLVGAIEHLLCNAAERGRMAARGRRIAEDGFSLEQVNRETLNLYERLLDTAPAAAETVQSVA